MSNSLSKIDHIVVLMFENRSFDNVLGTLYPASENFNGLSFNGTEFNLNPGSPDIYPVWNQPGTDTATMTIPNPDPGEAFQDMNLQLFGTTLAEGQNPQVASMGGFVWDYAPNTPYPSGIPNGDEWPTLPRTGSAGNLAKPGDIMHYFSTNSSNGNPAQLPVTGKLGKAFGVSDTWFASSPTQTWPNRFFLNCASSAGAVNNVDYTNQDYLHVPLDSVFEALDQGTPSTANWKVYFGDAPIAWTIKYVWDIWNNNSNFCPFYDEQFASDCQNNSLPKYSLIEPRYTSHLGTPNSNHPPYDMTYGEILLADVYNTIRNSPSWESTLLIVTYDEHGGCYDHMMPAFNATPPGKGWTLPKTSWFPFNRFGVRVPSLLISPYIQAGSVIRPDGYHYGETPYDHTSVIATINERFGSGTLTNRDAKAPSLASALTLSSSNMNNGPQNVTPPTVSNENASMAIAEAAEHQYDPQLRRLMKEGGIEK